jgi:serine protease Do
MCRAALLALAFTAAPAMAQQAPVQQAPVQQAPAPTDADMVRGLMPTVVNLRVVQAAAPPAPGAAGASISGGSSGPRVTSGSGFVVDPSGLIVTNTHVIDGAYTIVVTFADGEAEPARVVEAVRMLDIAVLKVTLDHPHPSVRWAEDGAVQAGDEVFAFGNPLGIGMSVTAGIVSALNRDIEETPFDHFIQTDAVINHGNSGGPLFNTKGEVVGVNTAIISPTTGYAGLGFAIPSETVRFVLDEVKRYGALRPGWIGIHATGVTKDMAAALGASRPEGLMLTEVAAGSPAAKAGLHVGDILLRFGGVVPTDGRHLQRLIIAAPLDSTVPILVRRGGQDMTIPVTVAAWPRQDYAQVNGGPAVPPPITPRRDLGLTFGAITDAARARYGLRPGQTGVLVTGVMSGTDAWLRGIGPGDVIMRVQDVVVKNGTDVQHEVDKVRTLGRSFALFLVQKKGSDAPGPRWLALRIGADRGDSTLAKNN